MLAYIVIAGHILNFESEKALKNVICLQSGSFHLLFLIVLNAWLLAGGWQSVQGSHVGQQSRAARPATTSSHPRTLATPAPPQLFVAW